MATANADGTGQTIAIVDAYDDANIFNDLDAFDNAMTIGVNGTAETLYQGYGSSSSFLTKAAPYGAPAGIVSDGEEISLDVEWAHAIAPGAKILLVEAASNALGDMLKAVDYARQQPGVEAVSMSWGLAEFAGEASDDSYFTTPSGHSGVTFVGATGDAGAPAIYPAFSPNVVGAGGTTLSIDGSNNYLSESGWSLSGGGISTQENQPSYQKGVVSQSSTQRTAPDIAFDADPNSGVAIYDSYGFSSPDPTPWEDIGGTSLAAPVWAALFAITNQDRVSVGLQPLDGPSGTLPKLYGLPSNDFHDITSGNNGYGARAGYDLVTGIGTPAANVLVPQLALTTVTVDATNDPSGDAFRIICSGSNTLIYVGYNVVDNIPTNQIYQIVIKGSAYNDSLTVDTTSGNPIPMGGITFNGGGGTNSLFVTSDASFDLAGSSLYLSGDNAGTIGTSNVTQATLTTTNSSVAHSNYVSNWVGNATLNLLPSDTSILYEPTNSSGSTFTAHPTTTNLTGSGYSYTTNGGGTLISVGNGASDVANLYDDGATGASTFTAHPIATTFQVGSVALEANGFSQVGATSSNSADSAVLADSSSASGQFYGHAKGGPTSGTLAVFQGSGWDEVASGFGQVSGESSNSASTATLDDQYSSATVYSHATYSFFKNTAAGYSNIASGFKQVVMESYNASDVAMMDDQYASGPSVVYSHANYSIFESSTPGAFQNIASGFREVQMASENAGDVANLDDEFADAPATVYSHPGYSLFEGNDGSFDNIASGFQTVRMTTYNAAQDVANLDDQGNDGHFYSYPTYGSRPMCARGGAAGARSRTPP